MSRRLENICQTERDQIRNIGKMLCKIVFCFVVAF